MITLAIIGFVLIIVVALYASYRSAKRTFEPRMLEAVGNVQFAIYQRLKLRYAASDGAHLAVKLAAAVSNELFNQEPQKAEAVSFRADNRELIAKRLSELKDDPELRAVLTQSLRVLAAVQFSKKEGQAEQIASHFKRLDELGILVPGGEAPRLSIFLPMVKKFCRDNYDEDAL